MPYELFWHLTHTKLKAFYKAEEMRERQRDYNNYMLGIYMMNALKSTVLNNSFWIGKNGTPYEYPKKPLLSEYGLSEEEKNRIQEDEKQKALDKWLAEQDAMRVNFRRSKVKKGDA